jgi:tetratricopeptide (TPR) repeat protein
VSDFGFDGYALDDADAAGPLHPLEIARDLIGAGKPRSALEVLGLHYDKHVDEPEYLLLCAEAWRANGDTLRAQHALLGAARLAPTDPRPLQALSELLAERGERDKAERVLAKAQALERSSVAAPEPLSSLMADPEEDLIAAAERQERSHQPMLSPRQLSIAVLGLGALLLLIGAVALLSKAGPAQELAARPAVEPSQAPDPSPPPDRGAEPSLAPPEELTPADEAIVSDVVPMMEVVEMEPPEPEPASDVPARAAPEPVPPRPRPAKPAPVRRSSSASASASSSSGRKQTPSTGGETTPEPDPASVRAELGSMDPAQLTRRADALFEQDHTGLAASYYRRALEIDPDYAPALVGMGRGILRAEKYEEAMTNATRALQLARGVDARPGLEAEAIYQMGRVHLERGKRETARQLLRQAISLDGVPAEAWFYLGEALATDNSPAARRAYEKYLKLVPTGSLADRARRAIQ